MTETPTCTNCAAPLTDHGYLCFTCTARLATYLRAVPDLLAELDTTITRQAKITAPEKGNGDKPIPFDVRASSAAVQIHTVIHGWIRVLLEEGADHPDADDKALLHRAPAHWLTLNLASVRMREWSGELASELKRASDHGWACIDRPEERFYAGPCGAEIEHPDGLMQCGTVLWARITDARTRCRGCGHIWDTTERRDWLLRAANDVLETARVIASALTIMRRKQVTAGTIRNLASDGLLEALGERGGAKLYRVGDVLDVLERRERQPETAGHAA